MYYVFFFFIVVILYGGVVKECFDMIDDVIKILMYIIFEGGDLCYINVIGEVCLVFMGLN